MAIPSAVSERLAKLEPLPAPLEGVLRVASTPADLRDELLAGLEQMPEVAQRVLASANAADRADLPAVDRLSAAVSRLGLAAVLQLAFDQYCRGVRQAAPAYGLSKHDIWTHSAAASLAAQDLLRRRPRWAGMRIAPLAAAAHDLGKMIISEVHPTGAWRLVDLRHRRHLTLSEAERELFGCTHAEVGAELARRWSLGAEAARAIAEHHLIEDARSFRMGDLVKVADRVATSLGVGGGSAGLVFPHDPESERRLKIKPRELEGVRQSVSEAMALLARR